MVGSPGLDYFSTDKGLALKNRFVAANRMSGAQRLGKWLFFQRELGQFLVKRPSEFR